MIDYRMNHRLKSWQLGVASHVLPCLGKKHEAVNYGGHQKSFWKDFTMWVWTGS